MLGPRVCWQLLLGCALLLGQPVFGDSDAAEEPPVAESEEPVSASQEAPEPEPESQEPEESEEPELEPEEPELEPEEPEPEEPKSRELTSDEMLEQNEKRSREWLKDDLSTPWNYEINRLQRTALEHHHKHSEEYYRPFENANLMQQKAIGTMIYLQMMVVKTNCTNDLKPKKEESDHSYFYRLYHADRPPRNCEPLANSKKENCWFTFFEDARNPGQPIVVDHSCIPFHKKSGRNFNFFPGSLVYHK